MRILFVTPGNGSHPHVYKVLNFLVRRDHEVHLLTVAPPSDGVGREGLDPAAILYPPLGAFHLRRLHLTLQRLLRLRKVIQDAKIDLVHAMFLGPNAWYAALAGSRPLVLSVMGNDLLPGQTPLGRGGGRLLSRLTLRRADAITCWSRNLAQWTEPFARRGVAVSILHGGIDLRAFTRDDTRARQLRAQLGVPDHARVVLSPRVMQPRCNIDVIVHAIPEIVRRVPEAYFVFLRMRSSTAEYAGEIERLILSQPSAKDRVRVVGEVVNAEMAAFYSLAEVTVSVASNDGTPLTVLESMACRTPAVVGRIAELDEHLFGDGVSVVMVPLRDPMSVASAVVRLMEDAAYRERLIESGRRIVETHGAYETEMKKLEGLYRSLLGEKGDVEA